MRISTALSLITLWAAIVSGCSQAPPARPLTPIKVVRSHERAATTSMLRAAVVVPADVSVVVLLDLKYLQSFLIGGGGSLFAGIDVNSKKLLSQLKLICVNIAGIDCTGGEWGIAFADKSLKHFGLVIHGSFQGTLKGQKSTLIDGQTVYDLGDELYFAQQGQQLILATAGAMKSVLGVLNGKLASLAKSPALAGFQKVAGMLGNDHKLLAIGNLAGMPLPVKLQFGGMSLDGQRRLTVVATGDAASLSSIKAMLLDELKKEQAKLLGTKTRALANEDVLPAIGAILGQAYFEMFRGLVERQEPKSGRFLLTIKLPAVPGLGLAYVGAGVFISALARNTTR